jgi:hypothetical protein
MIEVPEANLEEGYIPSASEENMLRSAVMASRVLPGNGIRIRYLPQGTVVSADSGAVAPWPHPWRVSIAEEGKLRVYPGLVNGAPVMYKDEILDETIEVNPGDPPKEGGITWVCVKVQVDYDTKELIAPNYLGKKLQDEDFIPPLSELEIVAESTWASGGSSDVGDGHGFHPVAQLVWEKGKKLKAAHTISMHNLQHAFVTAGKVRQSRHFFWPV